MRVRLLFLAICLFLPLVGYADTIGDPQINPRPCNPTLTTIVDPPATFIRGTQQLTTPGGFIASTPNGAEVCFENATGATLTGLNFTASTANTVGDIFNCPDSGDAFFANCQVSTDTVNHQVTFSFFGINADHPGILSTCDSAKTGLPCLGAFDFLAPGFPDSATFDPVATTPEPGTLALLGGSFPLLAGYRRLRNRRRPSGASLNLI